jgi:hypothetical protein
MKTIEELAREAGLYVDEFGIAPNAREDAPDITVAVKRFAALVRAQALEEAARALDQRQRDNEGWTEQEHEAEQCAAAVRALAEKPPSGLE